MANLENFHIICQILFWSSKQIAFRLASWHFTSSKHAVISFFSSESWVSWEMADMSLEIERETKGISSFIAVVPEERSSRALTKIFRVISTKWMILQTSVKVATPFMTRSKIKPNKTWQLQWEIPKSSVVWFSVTRDFCTRYIGWPLIVNLPKPPPPSPHATAPTWNKSVVHSWVNTGLFCWNNPRIRRIFSFASRSEGPGRAEEASTTLIQRYNIFVVAQHRQTFSCTRRAVFVALVNVFCLGWVVRMIITHCHWMSFGRDGWSLRASYSGLFIIQQHHQSSINKKKREENLGKPSNQSRNIPLLSHRKTQGDHNT